MQGEQGCVEVVLVVCISLAGLSRASHVKVDFIFFNPR